MKSIPWKHYDPAPYVNSLIIENHQQLHKNFFQVELQQREIEYDKSEAESREMCSS